MGKMSLNFLSRGRMEEDTVLSSPDTRFGPGLLGMPVEGAGAGAPSGAGSAAGSAEEAMLRLGNVMRRRDDPGRRSFL